MNIDIFSIIDVEGCWWGASGLFALEFVFFWYVRGFSQQTMIIGSSITICGSLVILQGIIIPVEVILPYSCYNVRI